MSIKDMLLGIGAGKASGGGGGGTHIDPEADVRFFDSYDGSIVASYSAADFANLNELPANPTHEGLTSQGWNWSLVDAKAQAAWSGFLDIGQMYIPDDDCTRVYVSIRGNRTPKMNPYLNGSGCSTTVDWGDNTTSDTITGAGRKSLTHTYAADGDYVIKIKVNAGKFWIDGNTSKYGSYLFSDGSSTFAPYQRKYLNCVKAIEVGKDTEIHEYAFNRFTNLTRLTLPKDCVMTGAYAISDNNLTHVTIPSGVTTIDSYFFADAGQLRSISIPNSITSIKATPISGCLSLSRFLVPNSATTFNNGLYQSVYYVHRVSIPSGITALPTNYLNSAGIFSIKVPQNITSIGQSALGGYFIQEIELPDTVTSLGTSAFDSAVSLTSIKMSSTLQTIGGSAFKDCQSLSQIEIPATVTSIGANAFTNCYGMAVIKFLGSTPSTVTSGAFSKLPTSCKILVPSGSLSAYTSTSNMPASGTYTYEEY